MADRVGQQLGNYQLIRLLGEGGFAEVYLSEHIHLGSQAAIKVLHSQLSSDDIDGFRKEARTIVRLIHPNIVRVLEFGIEGKTPFLVMDFAPNGTLRQRHPKGTALSLETVVSYVKQVADALQYAHDEKLIHRDIKPENMLIGRRNEILLSDFGIAIVAQSSRYQSTQDMAGTIAYMAPEQIQAHPRPSSDQYSLGIVVYEWLTGERPFHGSFSEIAIKHTIVPPPPIRDKIPTVSRDVEQIVMTALAKDPHDRFMNVQAFANALEQASQLDAPTFIKPVTPANPDVQSMRPASPPPASIPATQPARPTPPLDLPATELAMFAPPPVAPVTPSTTSTPPLPPRPYTVPPKPVGTTLYAYQHHVGRVNAVAWSPDGKYIASCGDDRRVQVWHAITGENVVRYTGHADTVRAVAWSPDGRRIASSSDDRTVQVWDAGTGRIVVNYRGHSNYVSAICWSPDGQCIASGSHDKTVQIWNASTGDKLVTYPGHSVYSVNAVAWSPDSRYIATAQGLVQIWDTATARILVTYKGHSYWIETVAWAPDGSIIASGGYDATVQIWNAAKGSHIYTYKEHTKSVCSIAWSPDGKLLASAGNDKGVRVWKPATGSKMYTYYGHSGNIKSLSWSSDGQYIASASDRTVHVWVAPS